MPIDLIRRLLPWAAVAFVSAWLGYAITANHYRAVIAENAAAAEKAFSEAQNRVIEQQKTQQIITSKVSSDYEKKIAEIRRQYQSVGNSNGVRINTPSGGLSVVPNPTGESNGRTADVLFVGECAETTQQLISLQEWVLDQFKVGQ